MAIDRCSAGIGDCEAISCEETKNRKYVPDFNRIILVLRGIDKQKTGCGVGGGGVHGEDV